MAVILVVLLGLSVASSLNLGNPQGLQFDVNSEYATSYEDYKPRDYKFEYGVSDSHTGDHKSHWEVRENGVVRGEYSLLEPDGTTRVVQYTADDHGFRAVVKKLGHAVHPSQHVQNIHNPITPPEVQNGGFGLPYYKTYDGAAENYINTVDNSNLESILGNIHQISEEPEHNSHAQVPNILSHSVAEGELDYHNYQSSGIPGVGGNTENHLVYGQTLETTHSDSHIPIQQESVYTPAPSLGQAPIHIEESILQEPVYRYESSHTQEPIIDYNQIQDHIRNHELIRIENPIQNHETSHIQASIQNHEPIVIQQPVHTQVHVISASNELPATIGLNVEHPHGESSSSFIGSTGNPEDDSAYTRHDKGSEVAEVQNYSGWRAYESPIPYQYLKKRSAVGKF